MDYQTAHHLNPMGSTNTQANPSWSQASISLNLGPERNGSARASNPSPIYSMPAGIYAATVGNVHKGEIVFSTSEEKHLSRSRTPMATRTLPGGASTLNGLGDTSDPSKSEAEQLRDLANNMVVLGICPREFDLVAQGNVGFIVHISGTGTVTNNGMYDIRLFDRIGWDFPDPSSDNPLDESSGRQDDNNGRKTLVMKPLNKIFDLYRLSDSLLNIELSQNVDSLVDDTLPRSKTKFVSPATQDHQRCVTGFTDASFSNFTTILSICLHFPELKDILKAISTTEDMNIRSNLIAQLVEILASPSQYPLETHLTDFYNDVFKEASQPKVSKAPDLLTYRQVMVLGLIRGKVFERSLCPASANPPVTIEFGKRPHTKKIFAKTLLDGSAGYLESNMRIHQSLIDRHKLGVALEPAAPKGDFDIMLTGATL